MHPAFYWWYKHARRSEREGCGPRAHAGWHGGHGEGHVDGGAHFGGHGGHGHGHGHDDGFFGGGGGPFGVRRPLRFLAHKLDLSEPQVTELARILDELKTERAQADVDHRRTLAAFAEAVESPTFGEARAREGGEQRVKSAERLREAVVKALAQIHGVLDEDQRKRLAYLVRTGVLAL
jgi:Spy/CpxP family protein refolding chaperone